MRRFSVLQLIGLAGFVCVMGSSSPVSAAMPSYPGAATAPQDLFNADARPPDVASIPALSNLVRSGGKLYYLGERSGIHGWFIVQDGQIQMLYLSPDKKTVIVGAMFSSEGENVTTPQISLLSESNKDVNALLNGTGREQKEVALAGNEGGAAAVSGDSHGNQKMSNNLPSSTLSPGERLIQDLKASANVSMGSADAPELIMVAATDCPVCKATWAELRSSVKEGKIQVRLIPVYNTAGGAAKREAAQLLHSKDPLNEWDRFVAGEEGALSGIPDDTAMRAVQSNLSLVAKWNIKGYPYLVYRGQDGRIKIVQGKPERMAAVLSDLRH